MDVQFLLTTWAIKTLVDDRLYLSQRPDKKTFKAHISSTTKLAEIPIALLTTPMIGVIIAPPTTAIIIRPEISLAPSGKVPMVIENTNGKRFSEHN